MRVPRETTLTERNRCDACLQRYWCAITTRNGARRCFLCWVAHYLRASAEF
jgi:hypothetical protein